MKRELLAHHVKRVPRCTTHAQFAEWRKAAAFYKPPFNIWFCQDCTPSFQRKNIKQGTCDHEYVQFYTKNGEIEGFIPTSQYDKHNKRLEDLKNDPSRLFITASKEASYYDDGGDTEIRDNQAGEQDL
jgi:hypothetical protein